MPKFTASQKNLFPPQKKSKKLILIVQKKPGINPFFLQKVSITLSPKIQKSDLNNPKETEKL